MALCVQQDIEHRLQWKVTSDPDARVDTLTADAQAMIEGSIGRTVESAPRTQTLDPDLPTLFLKYWPVTAVASVTEDGTATTDFMFYEDGRLIKASDGIQTNWATPKRQSIDVVYTGGYLAGSHDMELEHLGNLCAEVVARAFRSGAFFQRFRVRIRRLGDWRAWC